MYDNGENCQSFQQGILNNKIATGILPRSSTTGIISITTMSSGATPFAFNRKRSYLQ